MNSNQAPKRLSFYQRLDIKEAHPAHRARFKVSEFERHKDLVRALLAHQKAGPLSGQNVIDIGCNSGDVTALIGKLTEDITGIDCSEPLIELARTSFPRFEFLKADARSLPFADDTFDGFTSFHSLNAIPDGGWKRALDETIRVLKPNGIGIITIDRSFSIVETLVRAFYYYFGRVRSFKKTFRYARGKLKARFQSEHTGAPTSRNVIRYFEGSGSYDVTFVQPRTRWGWKRTEIGIIVTGRESRQH